MPRRLRALVRRMGVPAGIIGSVALTGCAAGAEPEAATASPVVTIAVPSAPATRPPPPQPRPTRAPASSPTPDDPAPIVVRYRAEVRTTDAATADFPAIVEETLADPRGWQRAGFRLERSPRARHLVVIAEADEVDALCLPYDTYGRYSCQNGPVVAINADRWREATPQWTGDLDTYRRMLVNHEVGHLLGQRHLPCPASGVPAPVMTQQSTNLDGCLPNPWPLDSEIEVAARHDQPIAPEFGQ